jgi:hypothetical protein
MIIGNEAASFFSFCGGEYTDKKEIKNFLIFKEIKVGAAAK